MLLSTLLDTLDSYFSIAAGGIAIVGALASGVALYRVCWPKWRRRHTYELDAVEPIHAGETVKVPLSVRVLRDTVVMDYMVRFRETRGGVWNVDESVIRGWISDKIKPLPRHLKRGESIPAELSIEGKVPWKGYIWFEASDGSGTFCSTTQDLEVLPAKEPE